MYFEILTIQSYVKLVIFSSLPSSTSFYRYKPETENDDFKSPICSFLNKINIIFYFIEDMLTCGQ